MSSLCTARPKRWWSPPLRASPGFLRRSFRTLEECALPLRSTSPSRRFCRGTSASSNQNSEWGLTSRSLCWLCLRNRSKTWPFAVFPICCCHSSTCNNNKHIWSNVYATVQTVSKQSKVQISIFVKKKKSFTNSSKGASHKFVFNGFCVDEDMRQCFYSAQRNRVVHGWKPRLLIKIILEKWGYKGWQWLAL